LIWKAVCDEAKVDSIPVTQESNSQSLILMNDYIDKGETGNFWDGNSGPAEVSRDLGRFERCSHRLRKVNSVKRQDEHLLWTDIGPSCLFVW
jgi:hypothetical protein